MKSRNSICVISVNKDNKKDLVKTLSSVNKQIIKPDLHLVIVKKIDRNTLSKFKKNYRKFIIGEDNSLYNAMNIGLKNSWDHNIVFLNGGDIFYNNQSISNIKKNIGEKKNCLIFKTILKYKKKIYYPKQLYFNSNNYLPHPSFVRPPVPKNKKKIYFTENNRIGSDGEWMRLNINKFNHKKINNIISVHYLGGISTNPTLQTLLKKIQESFFIFSLELLKFFIKLFFGQKNYYSIIYFFKFYNK